MKKATRVKVENVKQDTFLVGDMKTPNLVEVMPRILRFTPRPQPQHTLHFQLASPWPSIRDYPQNVCLLSHPLFEGDICTQYGPEDRDGLVRPRVLTPSNLSVEVPGTSFFLRSLNVDNCRWCWVVEQIDLALPPTQPPSYWLAESSTKAPTRFLKSWRPRVIFERFGDSDWETEIID